MFNKVVLKKIYVEKCLKIYKGLRDNARFRKLGQPDQPGPYEKALKPLGDVGSQVRALTMW